MVVASDARRSERGELDAAEPLYLKVLETNPNDVNTLILNRSRRETRSARAYNTLTLSA